MSRDILSHVTTRRALREVASILAGMEKHEADSFLKRLLEELQRLCKGDAKSTIWAQVSKSMSGPECYGLQRLGLLGGIENE